MELIINGRRAAIKKGSSFDYVCENRSFTDADAYSLSITLPLADCPQNLAIFGHIDRLDVETCKMALEASLVDVGLVKNGVVTVVEASPTEVKVQFLEGRSVQNFLTTFDDIYINELDLGQMSTVLPSTPEEAHRYAGYTAVALPWVNTTDIQNGVTIDDAGNMSWAPDTVATGKLSWQPYLIWITRRICTSQGYSCDLSEWEASPLRALLVCNTLPAAWDVPGYARALPHWSITEFFDELEKILVAEVDIDHRAKHVKVTLSHNISRPVVKLANVLDAHTADVAYDDPIGQYKGGANVRYADRSDAAWSREQCQWLIDLAARDGTINEFGTWADFAAYYDLDGLEVELSESDPRGEEFGRISHIRDTDRYIIWKVVKTRKFIHSGLTPGWTTYYWYQWFEINKFGDLINAPNSDEDIELRMVPAHLDATDEENGMCIFMEPSSFSEDETADEDGVTQPAAYSALLNGEPTDKAEYYNLIHLAIWNGESSNYTAGSSAALPPAPCVDSRLNLQNLYANYLSGIKVNSYERLKVSWLGTSIPDVRSIFHIGGHPYLCAKITVTFSETGMSELLKGEFFRIID